MWNMDGKIVVIAGAAQGIGFATAEAFAREGAHVVLADIDHEQNQQSAQQLQQSGASALAVECDVSRLESVKHLVDTVVRKYGRIDILHANAAVQINKPAAETSEEEWERLHSVNIRGTFLVCKYVVPVMTAQRRGVIVITSSGHAFRTHSNAAAYASTKGAQMAFMRGLALDYADSGVRVNCVVPGTTDTRLVQRYVAEFPDPKVARQKLIDVIPLQRLATPNDIANAVLFLASDYASYITGISLSVDGGLSAKI